MELVKWSWLKLMCYGDDKELKRGENRGKRREKERVGHGKIYETRQKICPETSS